MNRILVNLLVNGVVSIMSSVIIVWLVSQARLNLAAQDPNTVYADGTTLVEFTVLIPNSLVEGKTQGLDRLVCS